MSDPASGPRSARNTDYFSYPAGMRSARRASSSAKDMRPFSLSLSEIATPSTDVEELSGAPPSPSTLTDIILTLHSSLYSEKRSTPELREIMQRYYESSAGASPLTVFSSPLVTVHGRERIVDQFVLAFAIPTLNVASELRDIICSDFEFDGTRAGIIDHTIRVTFFPSIFGGSESPMSTAATTGNVTPHPFADTMYDNASPIPPAFPRSRTYSSGGWSARPRTPRSAAGATPNFRSNASPYNDKILSAGIVATPLPLDLGSQRWSAEGLGRTSVWVALARLLNPKRLLRTALTFDLRVLSRLEFNEAGRIVRHEDIWSLREFLEGFFPLVSICASVLTVYYVQRFILGVLTSWAVRLEFHGKAE